MTLFITLEGNIGSGKSTIFKSLKEKFKNDKTILFLDEPVDNWELFADSEGKTILEHYYSDQSKYSFTFQMLAYISRLSPLRKALKQNYDLIISERSIYTDCMIFTKMLFESYKIGEIEYKVYNKWFEEFLKEIPNPSVIYVKTNPRIAKERVNKRNRLGENISLDYLENCHRYHEEWIKSILQVNKLELNGNIDLKQTENQMNKWIEDIDNFIKLQYILKRKSKIKKYKKRTGPWSWRWDKHF